MLPLMAMVLGINRILILQNPIYSLLQYFYYVWKTTSICIDNTSHYIKFFFVENTGVLSISHYSVRTQGNVIHVSEGTAKLFLLCILSSVANSDLQKINWNFRYQELDCSKSLPL